MLVLTAMAVLAAADLAPLHTPEGTVVDGSFIVVFHETSTLEQRDAHMKLVNGALDAVSTVDRTYAFNKFFGYSAKFSPAVLAAVRADTGVVEFVESDQMMSIDAPVAERVEAPPAFMAASPEDGGAANCQMQLEATWGIVRTAERALNINGEYAYSETELGDGVDAYVLDTGIYTEHVEFEGRAQFGADFVGESGQSDGNGHGTHCAGTVGSKTYGLAKKATLIAVKVLSAGGSGSNAGVIDGVEFVCTEHQKKGNKCVANMSLGGGFSLALNRAVNNAVECGCQFAVASGNDARNACLYSPASADDAVTVNSIDNTDNPSWFSNYGSCSDIYAPGTSITSTWIGSPYAISTISGTSMAAPHVAGAMAKFLSSERLTPLELKAKLISDSTKDAIKNNDRETPNSLLYAPCSI